MLRCVRVQGNGATRVGGDATGALGVCDLFSEILVTPDSKKVHYYTKYATQNMKL